ncbi:MAG TPA: hypothetical protein VMU19_05265, partial [Bryobacteraceae bacterium]|nr:hypothetical protein [Bryobacteraceae bacterium]
MIYQLIRRDPAWKATPWFALVSAVVWAGASPMFNFGVLTLVIGLIGGTPNRRASRFQAGLPIEARDLLLARALSLMAIVWVPALSGTAGIVAVKGFSALAAKPLAVAALCTLMAATAQAAWLKELAGPQWALFSLFMLFVFAATLTVQHPVPLVPPLCALAGVGLFGWARVAVPRSFQLSSAGVKTYQAAGRHTGTGPLAAFRWAPVFRSVYSLKYLCFLTFVSFQVATGTWLFTTFWLLVAWLPLRPRTRWLWALPVGRRTLLWTMMGPLLAAHALGYLASFLTHRHAPPASEPRVVVAGLATILAWAMLTMLFCVLADWRGFARVPRRILSAAFSSLFVIWYGASVAALLFTRYSAAWEQHALSQLARAAPLSLPALIAAAAAVLIALYLAIEKVFSEPD